MLHNFPSFFKDYKNNQNIFSSESASQLKGKMLTSVSFLTASQVNSNSEKLYRKKINVQLKRRYHSPELTLRYILIK